MPTARVAPPRRAALLIAALGVLAGCTAAPGTTPAATGPGVACAAGEPAATQYAGWPRPGSGTASAAGFIPVLVSSEIAVGQNRFLVNLIDDDNEPLGDPALEVEMRFFELAGDPAAPEASVEAAFVPTVASHGIYRADVTFSCAGDWGVEVIGRRAGTEERSARVLFGVRPATSTPTIGAPAPPSETPVATSPMEIAALSTDDDPDPAFYATSVADAVAANEPFVLVFATPAFCKTATCGPALDIVKSAAADFKDRLTFINVEPYELEERDGQLQPVVDENGSFVPVPSVTEWGLVTEPYTFVVDAEGRVAAKFEGVAGADELRAAFEAVARD
jgi:hypothetical protein